MIDRALRPAGNGRRFSAYLVDNFAWIVAIAVLPPAVGLLALLAWIGWWVALSIQGMSPGKKVLGLVCVDVHSGRPAGFGKMLVRDFLAKGLLGAVTFGITGLVGAIQILGSSDRRALWDQMTDTLVVERSSSAVSAVARSDRAPTSPATPPALRTVADGPANVVAPHALPPDGPSPPVIEHPPALPAVDSSGLEDETVARGAVAPAAPEAAQQWVITSSWGLRRAVAPGTIVFVGREPESEGGGSSVEIERTPPGARAVSKTHCVLRVGPMVEVEDRGSRNGTVVEPPGGRAVALRPNDPVPVVAGTRVVLGDQWMQIDALA